MGWNDHLIDDDTNPDLSVWAYRHGWVGVDEAPSGEGRVRVATATVVKALWRELLGFHDAANAVASLSRGMDGPDTVFSWEYVEDVVDDTGFYIDPASRWVADPANAIAMSEREELELQFPALIPYLRRGGSSLCESPAEEAFARAFAACSLPYDFIAQYPVSRYRLDFYAPSRRLAVEVDGAAYHASPSQREADRQRQQEIAAYGIRFLRIPAVKVLQCADQALTVLYRAEHRRSASQSLRKK